VDEHAFDRLARSLSAAPTRRRLLGSVLAGVATVLAGAASIQAQGRGRGLALGVGKDKGRPAEVGSAVEHGGGAAANGAAVEGPEELDVDEVEETDKVEDIGVGKGTTKVSICHKGKVITVGAPALTAHQRNHGDAVCQNCTVYDKGGPCTVVTADVEVKVATCECAAGITPEAEAVDAAIEEEDVAEAQRATPRGRQSSRRAKRRARLEARRMEKRAR
jgi:hypothetical protein